MGITRSRQKKWLGLIMRGLPKTIPEGRMEVKRTIGRLRMILLDKVMKEDNSKSKERAGQDDE